MLTDKAKLMMLLNEAARNNKKTEALKIICDHQKSGSMIDWTGACHAIERLLTPTQRAALVETRPPIRAGAA